jgi:RNA methyltransferase, TrmH family
MISKREVKYIQSLCHKKQRVEDRLFIVEGEKAVEELLQSNWEVKQIYATTSWKADHEQVSALVEVATREQIQQMSGLITARNVLALVQIPPDTEPMLAPAGLTLVLDTIQDPGNMGTLLRIADWFGIKQIIASDSSADCYNPKVVQASMGSFLRVTVYYTNLGQWLQSYPHPIMGAMMQGTPIYDVKSVLPAALLIGNEGKGISEALLPLISTSVSIPRLGNAESLNAAVATGILLSYLTQV